MNNEATIKLYQAISESNEDRVFKHFHASSIADCPRAHYMKRMGIAGLEKPSAAKILRWKTGHLAEQAFRDFVPVLFDKDTEIKSNVRLTSKKLDLTGEYDNYSPEFKTLVEIKTVHDYAFVERDGKTYLKDHDGFDAKGRNKWKAKDTPYLHHEIQNHCYVKLLAEEGEIVEAIKYVYISLSGRIVVYDTKIQEDIMGNVNRRLEALNKAWKDQVPPECICKEGHPLYDSVMKWCPYREENNCCVIKE